MRLTVRSKLVLSAVLAIAVAAMVATVGYFGTRSVRGSMAEVVESSRALRLQLEADQIHDALRGDVFAALHDATQPGRARDKAVKRGDEHAADLLRRIQESRAHAPAQVRPAIDAALPALERFARLGQDQVALAYDDHPRATQEVHVFMNAFRDVEKDMNRIEEALAQNNETVQQAGTAAADTAARAMFAVFAAASFLLVTFSVMLARGILRPLRTASDAATLVASGDLSKPIEQGTDDEIGSLLRALEKMRTDLAAAVAEIQLAARNVDTGSREISRGNSDLSGRTEEQASSLEETASSMEEITATIKRNTDNALQANALAADAAGIARRGGEAMHGVVTTMGGISDASRRIGEITGVIDGIAFQTNILALNAAVEAARAGEHGRGFAVVASEVRALAQRCSVAAKEIKDLIAEASRRVSEGTGQVDAAGKTMQQIVDAVDSVSGIVREISEASAEQLRGIEQVSRAVTQMDQVVQQNAALVEEAAAAAENLAGQAQTMAVTVRHFKLGDTIAANEPYRAGESAKPPMSAATPAHAKPRGGLAVVVPPRGVKPRPALEGEWQEF